MQIRNLFYFLMLIAFTSCEEVIPVKLDEGTTQIVVDAFVNDLRSTQTIKLLKTTPYFNNATPSPVLGANVSIKDSDGTLYNFIDFDNSGSYVWSPSPTDTLVHTGKTYTLTVKYDGEIFMANSTAFPVPSIDSLTYEYREENGPGAVAGYYPSVFATDLAGIGNYYWIRSFKNGVYYSAPSQINISQDGAFGAGIDGLTFILPIRQNIIPFNEPLALGDSIYVELNAINPDTYFFLQEVVTQTNNGGLFATPPANVSTNIKNTNVGSSVKPLGFFNVAKVSMAGIRIE